MAHYNFRWQKVKIKEYLTQSKSECRLIFSGVMTDQDIKVIRKGFKGPAKPKREYFIADIIPDGI
jgi:hypothetical protein